MKNESTGVRLCLDLVQFEWMNKNPIGKYERVENEQLELHRIEINDLTRASTISTNRPIKINDIEFSRNLNTLKIAFFQMYDYNQ